MTRILSVFLDHDLVGRLTQNDVGKIRFRYDSKWLENPCRRPLSMSLPLQAATFNAKACLGFFSGLLPEAELRKIIAKNLGVSDRNDFSLLERIGGDCAGAVTFLSEGKIPPKTPYEYKALTDHELADELRKLPLRPLLAGEDRMRLSLAGAQSKLAVSIQDGTLSLPLDGAPSTHILKPGNPRFENLVFNEGFCMRLAGRVGLSVASVEIKSVEEISYLLIERYDRKIIKESPIYKRLHQEDFCQALAIVSEMKYQKEGGPSLKKCFQLVRQHASVPAVDLSRLLDAVIYNYLIGNNDAHGKNFSFLYDWEADFSADAVDPLGFSAKPTMKISLAPLYDLVSTVYYPDLSCDMAMSIGNKYHLETLMLRQFEELAEEIGFTKTAVRRRVCEFTEKLNMTLNNAEFDDPLINPIKDMIKKRCQRILTQSIR